MKIYKIEDLIEKVTDRSPSITLERNNKQYASVKNAFDLLSEVLPEDMDVFFSKYALNFETFGGFWFPKGGKLTDEWISKNTLHSIANDIGRPRWWQSGLRPHGTIMIGATDGHIILLECMTGTISGYSRDESHKEKACISKSFSLLIEGFGNVYLQRDDVDADALVDAIHSMVGASHIESAQLFWRELCF
jgi:hypothetical protein